MKVGLKKESWFTNSKAYTSFKFKISNFMQVPNKTQMEGYLAIHLYTFYKNLWKLLHD